MEQKERSRARHRALAELATLHRDEYRELYQRHLGAVEGAVIGALPRKVVKEAVKVAPEAGDVCKCDHPLASHRRDANRTCTKCFCRGFRLA